MENNSSYEYRGPLCAINSSYIESRWFKISAALWISGLIVFIIAWLTRLINPTLKEDAYIENVGYENQSERDEYIWKANKISITGGIFAATSLLVGGTGYIRHKFFRRSRNASDPLPRYASLLDMNEASVSRDIPPPSYASLLGMNEASVSRDAPPPSYASLLDMNGSNVSEDVPPPSYEEALILIGGGGQSL